MKGARVSLCYYPTTIILVDDQENFLNELKAGLNDQIPCLYHSDPKKLIDFFKTYRAEHFTDYCVLHDEDSALENLIVRQISLPKIRNEIYNQDRFKQISLFVADFAMPGHNGLECCDAIRDKFIQKLLLTGEAQNDLAVKAFNERRINKFIQKSAPNLIQAVNEAVDELTLNYFLQLSDSLRGNMASDLGEMLTILDDPVFVNFFYQVCESNKIAEYYILDNQGSFLLLDEKGEAFWLLMKDETEMENLFQHAKIEEASSVVQQVLHDRSHLPFFYTEADMQTPPSQWGDHLYPAERLVGQHQTYYYSLLTDAPFSDIDAKAIKTVQQFLRESSI
jgi:CheY-like chemotaxis protein